MSRKMYMCGVDWQHELCEAPDLEGKAPLYSSIEECKKGRSKCWAECGIVEVEVTVTKWVEPQNLFNPAKLKTAEDLEAEQEVDIIRTIP